MPTFIHQTPSDPNLLSPVTKEIRVVKVEIWPGVMCPFAYIGKRRFEKALEQFPGKGCIEVPWKSFQLDPNRKTKPGKKSHHICRK